MSRTPVQRRVIVADTPDDVAALAAERLIARLASVKGRAAICLTGGSSPQRLYELLATAAYARKIPWDRVHWFMGDDRFVPPGDPLSNIGMARRAFLDACAAPGTVHPIPTQAESPHHAAREYEAELRSLSDRHLTQSMFDLVLMGVGPDGHTASLFPDSAALGERKHWVVGVDTANVAPFVPRVTLTFRALNACREMLFQVTGRDKRDIIQTVFSHDGLPAARVDPAGELVWLLDREAAPANANV